MIYFTELQISFKLDVMRISHADIAEEIKETGKIIEKSHEPAKVIYLLPYHRLFISSSHLSSRLSFLPHPLPSCPCLYPYPSCLSYPSSCLYPCHHPPQVRDPVEIKCMKGKQ